MTVTQCTMPWQPLSDDEKPRSPGLHVSDVIRQIMINRDPGKFQADAPLNLGKMEVGCAWEHYDKWRRRLQGEDFTTNLEYQRDGILCTPDGVSATHVLEWKATWSKPDRPVADFHWYWVMQVAAYAYVTKRRHATILVLCVNGDYKPMDPVPVQIDLSFTKRDLAENWREILGQAKRMGKGNEGGNQNKGG